MCYLCHCGDYLGHLWRQAGKLLDWGGVFIADWMHEKPSEPNNQTSTWPTFIRISHWAFSFNEISFIFILSVRIHTHLFEFVCPKMFRPIYIRIYNWMADHFLLSSLIWSNDSHFGWHFNLGSKQWQMSSCPTPQQSKWNSFGDTLILKGYFVSLCSWEVSKIYYYLILFKKYLTQHTHPKITFS